MAIYNINGVNLDEIGANAFRDNAEMETLFWQRAFGIQGGCTDGENIYYCNNQDYILRKYNIATGVVDASSAFSEAQVGHANDMTYNPNTGKLYLTVMDDGGHVAIFDPGTLALDSTIALTDGNGNVIPQHGIAYDRKNDRYVVSVSGTQGKQFALFNGSFVYQRTLTVERPESYTLQGIETDGKYIYRSLSNTGTDAMIVVYDFDGKIVGTIKVDDPNEIENIQYDWDGHWYLMFGNSASRYCCRCNFMLHVSLDDLHAWGKADVRTVVPKWEYGGIEGSGFIDNDYNMRTPDGFIIYPGESVEIICTSKAMRTAIYANGFSDGKFKLVTNGYIDGYSRHVFSDWRRTYYLRIRPIADNVQPTYSDCASWTVRIHRAATYPMRIAIPRNIGNVCYRRDYIYIGQMLTWQRKNLESDGTLSDSTTRVVAELPHNGSVEVRQNRYTGMFKVAKVVGSTVTWLTGSGWSYYVCRYQATGDAKYYVVAAASPADGASAGTEGGTAAITAEEAQERIGVYSYLDVGEIARESITALYGKKIAFIGDSITQGRFRKQVDSGLNWTASKRFGDLIAEIANDPAYGNFGIGGALTSGSEWKSLLSNCGKVSGYDVVFICGGTNDYGNNATEANFKSAYRTIVDTLAANNTEVVAVTPVYRTSMTGANSRGLYLYDYVDFIKSVATEKSIKCIDLYTRTNDSNFINYCPDGLHPNEMGHRLIADHILEEYDAQYEWA